MSTENTAQKTASASAPGSAMPPGRDCIPPNHPRRIAGIYHLSERELAHESVEVRQLCRNYRDAIWRSEKEAKVQRGEMLCEMEAIAKELLGHIESANTGVDDEIHLSWPVLGPVQIAEVRARISKVLQRLG